MIVTTSQNDRPNAILRAKSVAEELQIPFISRMDRSIEMLQEEYGDNILVINSQEIKWHRSKDKDPFFFHPGLSVVRIKRLIRGDNDIMIQTCGLQPGDSFLDCTLGLAADAIVASFAVGKQGRVVGIESEPMVAFLVAQGLKEIKAIPPIAEAAARVEVYSTHHLEALREFSDRCFDVVYFDPMFRQGIKESASLCKLRKYANPSPISKETIREAVRVAKKRVVLKEHKNSEEWLRLGFSPVRRENMDITYGVIEV